MGPLIEVLRGWLGQEVARRNAGQAAVRLQHRRRQLEDLDAFLAAHGYEAPRLATAGPHCTCTVHVGRPRHAPL